MQYRCLWSECNQFLSKQVRLSEDHDWVNKCMEYELEVPDGEVDQRERLCKNSVKHVNLTRRMLWIVVDGS